jgi:hypothetical protein
MNALRNEAVELCSTAESLTGRLDRVAADTVQLILEGDNIIRDHSVKYTDLVRNNEDDKHPMVLG